MTTGKSKREGTGEQSAASLGRGGSSAPQAASEALRLLPSVDRVASDPRGLKLLEQVSREFLLSTVRSVIEDLRRELIQGKTPFSGGGDEVQTVIERVRKELVPRPSLVSVINATGIVLHTNLGRAPLAEAAIREVVTAARGAVAIEYDVSRGRRGERDEVVEEALCLLTGAEAATVVNNNAAALLLALNSLAEGREVIVSRGELVEIGGSFRLPEVMAKSGAILREVGTTNRTHLGDYKRAAGPETGLLLKVHTSNYRVVGFTASVDLEDLVNLGRELDTPVMEDLGSGALVDLSRWGLPREPVVAERISAGADLVSFSGDKLLGGPQAGILVGSKQVIERLRRNPLRRAIRPGKLTLAALRGTLELYRRSPDLSAVLPTLRGLCRPLAELREIAESAASSLAQLLGGDYSVTVEEGEAQAGSGSLPTETLPSVVLVITSKRLTPEAIAERFRLAAQPVIGRVQGGRFLLDVRLVEKADDLLPKAG